MYAENSIKKGRQKLTFNKNLSSPNNLLKNNVKIPLLIKRSSKPKEKIDANKWGGSENYLFAYCYMCVVL